MKSWIGRSVLPLAFVLVALATPTYAQSNEESDERGCSNAMLSGNYAFTIGGQILVIPRFRHASRNRSSIRPGWRFRDAF
jgi:hypothetical protein